VANLFKKSILLDFLIKFIWSQKYHFFVSGGITIPKPRFLQKFVVNNKKSLYGRGINEPVERLNVSDFWAVNNRPKTLKTRQNLVELK